MWSNRGDNYESNLQVYWHQSTGMLAINLSACWVIEPLHSINTIKCLENDVSWCFSLGIITSRQHKTTLPPPASATPCRVHPSQAARRGTATAPGEVLPVAQDSEVARTSQIQRKMKVRVDLFTHIVLPLVIDDPLPTFFYSWGQWRQCGWE